MTSTETALTKSAKPSGNLQFYNLGLPEVSKQQGKFNLSLQDYDIVDNMSDLLQSYDVPDAQRHLVGRYLLIHPEVQPYLQELREEALRFFKPTPKIDLRYFESPTGDEDHLNVLIRMPVNDFEEIVQLNDDFYDHFIDDRREFFGRVNVSVTRSK